ncbi:MAG: hypothetical protein AB8F94_08155 [Saprospiraceae bacterium]
MVYSRISRPTHPGNVGVRLPKNWTDLGNIRFNWYVDHVSKIVEFSCTIKNSGDIPATGPFTIVFGVSYSILNPNSRATVPRTVSIEDRLMFENNEEIEGDGTFTTRRIRAELEYLFPGNSSNVYTLEVIIDAEQELEERSISNNRKKLEWYMLDPNAFDQ